MDEKEYLFKMLIQIAEAFTAMFPKNFEVVLHDLSEPRQSIRHISGSVTGRKVGGPVTDLVLKALYREGSEAKDRHNYKTTSRDGRTLKSSTVFIRDSRNEVIGAFCINFDTTDYSNAVHALEMFTGLFPGIGGQEKMETFSGSIVETIETLFEQAEAKIGKQSATMTMEERIETVKELDASGVFKIKGGIDQVALLMGVSKYTVYNYLKRMQAEKDMQRI
ncbi:helix-turn-helix transcriptional regulator [Desulfobotulus sp. H1]|uniref:Helix-turn-helix transcriptional regulator n=1 Tax=Desulfobotulus pelophilus TaxID=2823377 RepID=A0ABT3N7W7_9BACT|nr:helix-turn-helix transcriptional regulator [Desulfobotulus pelophilus]MCW7753256.1 helix-turn-helix transcriptional regulator [Desulfobotulus pelophilus]